MWGGDGEGCTKHDPRPLPTRQLRGNLTLLLRAHSGLLMGEFMKKASFAFAAALAAALFAAPASAVTFPSLTTIYIGSGVSDNGGAANTGTATTFHCSNVSGVTAQVRFLVLNSAGAVAGSSTHNASHGATLTVSTHGTFAYAENSALSAGVVNEGVINIESTQSAVFCTAKTIDAALASPVGVPLDLVRVNPHPGTVE
jgi:hypothetical protein